MPFGRLAARVATMPSWVGLIVRLRELARQPSGGSNAAQRPVKTSAEPLLAHDAAMAQARASPAAATDEHPTRPWRIFVSSEFVSEKPRHMVLRGTFTHLASRRGQLTAYRRLSGAGAVARGGASVGPCQTAHSSSPLPGRGARKRQGR